MEIGKHLARITDYGITTTKDGKAQVFVTFHVSNESGTWYGMPLKKDGEANDMCLMQLASCGLDLAINTVEDLSKGVDSNILITDEDIEIHVKEVMQNDGSMKRRIDSIGEFGPARVTAAEVVNLISDAAREKIKSVAGKFKVRKKTVKENPKEDVPF